MLDNIKVIIEDTYGAKVTNVSYTNMKSDKMSDKYIISIPEFYKYFPNWVLNCIIDHEKGHVIHGDTYKNVTSYKQNFVEELRADGYSASIHGPIVVFLAMVISTIIDESVSLINGLLKSKRNLLSKIILLPCIILSLPLSIINNLLYNTNKRIFLLLIPKPKGYYNRFKSNDLSENDIIKKQYRFIKRHSQLKENIIIATENCINANNKLIKANKDLADSNIRNSKKIQLKKEYGLLKKENINYLNKIKLLKKEVYYLNKVKLKWC